MLETAMQSLYLEDKTTQAILNSLAEGIIVADKDGNFIFFNPAAEEILGIGLQIISPAEWSTTYGCFYQDQNTPFPPDQLPLARAIEGEEVENEIVFIKNPRKTEGAFVSISASPLKDSEGILIGGTVIFRDITEQRQAEMRLKQSKERLRAQFKGFPIPTYVWRQTDNDFVLIDYNDAAKDFTQGYIKNYRGSKLSEMYADYPDAIANFSRCINEKAIIHQEMSYQFQSTGEFKELVVSYVHVPPNLVMVHTKDVTEQKQVSDELKKLSNAVEQTADSVVITNKKGLIEYVNPAFEKITGYSEDEVLNQKPGMIKSGMHDLEFFKKMWSTLMKGKAYRGTIINKKKNGSLFWCEQTITPMKDKYGEINHYVSVAKDITELREKQEQEFRLRIAHELQQRLAKSSISIPGYDIAGKTYSALETTGDFFDFISMPDGHIGIVIGDVCGHGIGAAMIMAETRAYIRAFSKLESDPAIILNWLNKELVSDLDEQHFVTLILARLDPEKQILDYANAGHGSAYILDSLGEIKHELKSTGIPAGYLADWEYTKSGPIKLEEGSILTLLTDGISEAQAPDESEFGDERALSIVKEHSRASASQVLEEVYQAVCAFTHNQRQEDDITSIICKVSMHGKNI